MCIISKPIHGNEDFWPIAIQGKHSLSNSRSRLVRVLASGFLLFGASFGLVSESISIPGLSFTDSTQTMLAVRVEPNWCKNCGGPHGGVKDPYYCHFCINKGETPIKPLSKKPWSTVKGAR